MDTRRKVLGITGLALGVLGFLIAYGTFAYFHYAWEIPLGSAYVQDYSPGLWNLMVGGLGLAIIGFFMALYNFSYDEREWSDTRPPSCSENGCGA